MRGRPKGAGAKPRAPASWDISTNANLKKERIYLGSYEIYRERTSSGVQFERHTLHVMDDAQRIAMVETKTIEGGSAIGSPVDKIRYQLGNHLGSAVVECTETGAVISYEETSPYGSSTYRSASGSIDVSARRYRYNGKERDEETGLYYYGARYLAAWLGRWTSADPLGIGADGPGLYNYVRGSPVNYVDPGGTQTMPPIIVEPTRVIKRPTAVFEPLRPAAEFFRQVSKWKAEKVASREAEIDAKVASEGGGVDAQVRGGLDKFGMKLGAAIAYAPGTFFDMVSGMHSSYQKGGGGKVLEDVVSAPKQSLDRAHQAATEGNWMAATENLLGFGSQILGLVASGSQLTVKPGPPVAVQPALAGAGGTVAQGMISLPVVGGVAEAALGGLVSMMTGRGDDSDDPFDDRGEEWDEEGGVNFAKSKDLYQAGPGQRSVVTVEYTGDYVTDTLAANKAGGFTTKPKGYTWHHLNDYNVTTNKGTLQLVKDEAHGANQPHKGGVAQYEKATGREYTFMGRTRGGR